MSIFRDVHWGVWAAVLVFGGVLGLLAATLMSGRKPAWKPHSRIVTAALLPPLVVAAGAIIGAVWAAAGSDADHWGYLAAAALLHIGMFAVPLAFLGGLLAASITDRLLLE